MLIETITTQNLLKPESPHVVKHEEVVIDFNCSQVFLFGEIMKRVRKLKRKVNGHYCQCGCGQEITKEGNRFIQGHGGYGKHRSEETKKKISKNYQGFKGRKHTDESKKKMAISHRNMSDETKLKMSKNHKGMLGKIHTDESKKKMSIVAIGRKHSKEQVIKQAIAQMKCRTDGYCDAWSDNEYKQELRKDYCENVDCSGNFKIMNLHHINLDNMNCHPDDFITFCVGCHTLLHRKLNNINGKKIATKEDFITLIKKDRIIYIHKETQKQIIIKRKEIKIG